MNVSKKDWKLYRERIGEWQEAYMERLINEYTELLNGPKHASEKFWELKKRIDTDRKSPGVIIELNKGNMIYDIAGMIRLGIITVSDLDGFSDELKEDVTFFLNRF